MPPESPDAAFPNGQPLRWVLLASSLSAVTANEGGADTRTAFAHSHGLRTISDRIDSSCKYEALGLQLLVV